MATTDEVIELARLSRDRTVVLSDAQIVALTGAWVAAWDALEPEFTAALLLVIGDQADKTIPASKLAQSQRVTQAMQQARSTLENLAAQTNEVIINDLSAVMLNAAEGHIATLQAQLPEQAPGITLGRLRADEIDAMVARTSQVIHATTQPLPDAVEQRMKAQLIRGQVVGANPNDTARRIIQQTGDEFHGGLVRATRIARTETLDAHRTADHLAAEKNAGITDGWEWLATLDARSCGACISMHGQRFPNEEPGPAGHQNCRCTRVQVTKSWAELGFTGIEDTGIDLEAQRNAWFHNLTDVTQRQILGPGKYDLWQTNQIGWDDLAKRVDTPGWRPAYIETPLKDLTR